MDNFPAAPELLQLLEEYQYHLCASTMFATCSLFKEGRQIDDDINRRHHNAVLKDYQEDVAIFQRTMTTILYNLNVSIQNDSAITAEVKDAVEKYIAKAFNNATFTVAEGKVATRAKLYKTSNEAIELHKSKAKHEDLVLFNIFKSLITKVNSYFEEHTELALELFEALTLDEDEGA